MIIKITTLVLAAVLILSQGACRDVGTQNGHGGQQAPSAVR